MRSEQPGEPKQNSSRGNHALMSIGAMLAMELYAMCGRLRAELCQVLAMEHAVESMQMPLTDYCFGCVLSNAE